MSERDFLLALRAEGMPEPMREYRFAPPRRFRFDFAWPLWRVAVEIEGGEFARGRHVRGAGYVRDCEKYNLAVQLGWRVFRFAGSEVRRDPFGCVRIVRQSLADVQSDGQELEKGG